MSITVAESAGFCFGVKRAVELVEQQASMGGQVATLGPIIHNRHAVKHFEDMGVKVLGCAEDAQPGSTGSLEGNVLHGSLPAGPRLP